jgi:predicted RNA-binding Zn ribbon-like protein
MPRARGLREAIRQVLVTRQAVVATRTKAINELKSLIVTVPEQLRGQLRSRPLTRQLDRIDHLACPVTGSAAAATQT